MKKKKGVQKETSLDNENNSGDSNIIDSDLNSKNNFHSRNDVINSVSELVEKSGISRIANNLEEKMQEYEMSERVSIELENRLFETKRLNTKKEKELNMKTETLSNELKKFAEKAEIIKRKNEEFEDKTRQIKNENIEIEKLNVSEIEDFNHKIMQDSEIEEKFSKLKIVSKNILDMERIDKELTSEIELKNKNESFSGTATVVIDEDE